MPKKLRALFKPRTGISKEDHSPRSGLLAVSRVFRGLGTARLIAQHLDFKVTSIGEIAEATLPNNSITSAQIVEAIVLLQIAGADCVDDLDMLRCDPCLVEGLSLPIPGTSKVLEFLRALGHDRIALSDTPHPWEKVMADIISVVRGKCEQLNGGVDMATIDVEVVPDPLASRLVWKPGRRFPTRIVCIWREADLILSGGLCHDDADVVRCLQAALAVANKFEIRRLLRMGPVCSSVPVHSWIQDQVYRYERGIPCLGTRCYKTQVGYIQCMAERPENLENLLTANGNDWHNMSINCTVQGQWAKLEMKQDPGNSYFLALRRPHNDENHCEYAVLQTNLEKVDDTLLVRFLEGKERIARSVNEIQQLALGAFPQEKAGLAGEGRFLLALLSYNIFSGIRQLVFQGADQRMCLDRFRLQLIQGVGRMMTEEKCRWLRLSQSRVSDIFQKIWREFPP